MTIIYFLITLGILIFVHELGHFLVAKLANVKVEKFSLGFGPKLIGKRFGETEYLISALPLGGYVKMLGEGGVIEGGEGEPQSANEETLSPAQDNSLGEEKEKRSFAHKSPLIRMAIVLAGPVFNLMFAWIAFIFLCMLGVPTMTTKIGEVIKDTPAWKAGIAKNDVVLSIDSKPITHWEDVKAIIPKSKGNPLNIVVKRDDRTLQFNVTPETLATKNLFGETVNNFAIGVAPAGEFVTEYYAPLQAIVKGTSQTITVIDITLKSILKMFQRIIPLDNVGGPIMIAKMAGEQASAGGANFLAFMALISINLGILNLLPVPVLDGGHLVFYFWELLFGKPMKLKVREYAQQIGLVLIMGLMALAIYNDIVRYLDGIIRYFHNIIRYFV